MNNDDGTKEAFLQYVIFTNERIENIEHAIKSIHNDIFELTKRSPLPNEQWIEERLRALEHQTKGINDMIKALNVAKFLIEEK